MTHDRRYRFLLLAIGLLSIALDDRLAAQDSGFHAVECEGRYKGHLQGVCTDERESIFWCFTTKLVKTDRDGTILKQIDVGDHHGDLCFREGKVYSAVNFGEFNNPDGKSDSWVYVYRADDLSLVAKHQTPEVIYGAGGIACCHDRFFVVGGLPDGVQENYLYEYDERFQFVKKHVLNSGHTHLGIQTAAFADGQWWFGCYGMPKILLKVDESLQKIERFEFDCSFGIVPVGDGRFLAAKEGIKNADGWVGKLEVVRADPKRGLVLDK